ncbi:hypothetical protein ADINL_0285 [Nitrincola lacisaponensis]|uniref:Fungal lipase-like domain-containing protein n=2 Tax=Nitrincola lacisaponensis TaxID=267850 RepID=A0A063YA55_9GAMM|nr:hypothetical protein ADINL_0285 [Nitrincola lacisaponensis]
MPLDIIMKLSLLMMPWLLLGLLLLQGCGALKVSLAGYHEQKELNQTFRDCRQQNSHNCDQDLVILVPPPVLLTREGRQVSHRTPSVQALYDANDVDQLAQILTLPALLSDWIYSVDSMHLHGSESSVCEALVARSSDLPVFFGWRYLANPKACASDGSLLYTTFFRINESEGVYQYMIVFRGTTNTRSHILSDWSNNFSAALGIPPKQYQIAIETLKDTLAVISDHSKDATRVEIYTAGHSLGGGQAQQAAYLHDNVAAAWVFNTSPVTNWSELKLHDVHKDVEIDSLIQQADPHIIRVENQGEVLDYVRFFSTRANLRRFNRMDIELYFEMPGVFNAHRIGLLACHLAARVAYPDQTSSVQQDALSSLMGVNQEEARKLFMRNGYCRQPVKKSSCKTLYHEVCQSLSLGVHNDRFNQLCLGH